MRGIENCNDKKNNSYVKLIPNIFLIETIFDKL